ncbi:dTDP-4-dehydrorhamnose 3,5-epimerase [Brevundimonas sp. 357]|jgi:dTDP-4-dehydrorhamnose 3,5-epimerase|uniref:dTDP-4-dehydrorhamnose 3,5-epimerase n=1 Tax=Brevundimonas sp. 357 TaxID=2555782 RepID=UPI000F78DC99|nr:dTDP-4-dehydrorhamnose 3,5-epimerase [Brevundimonas sp. 357]RSB42226.1 dTDP-4-dehydrorhamnose 3,5-epimerase [Brevundimonas sp. 357]
MKNFTPALLRAPRFGDARGWFMETYSEARARAAGFDVHFVQDNQSFSANTGTIRGLHFQRPPHAQAKLVRCVRGSIMDYAVDLRRGSPTYGKWVGAKLTAEGGEQLFVPVGFGHAFITLEPDVEVAYKVTDVYAPDCDGGIVWNDQTINIDWPLPASGAILSDKDKILPTLAEFDSPFEYDGQPLEPLAAL